LERFISERAFRTPLSGIKKFSEKALALGDVIRLELGEPDFDTPTYIKEAAKEAMEKGYTHYTAIAGIPELREAIAEKLREENGIEADPENEILVTCGGYHAVFAVFNIFLNPGDEAKVTAQLLHPGRYAPSIITGRQPVAPSPIPSKFTGETPKELTVEEIKEIEEKFAEAAKRAKLAGFDGVELYASAGYLFSQFLSPATNKRGDEYGGSLKNRMRFLIETVEKIKNVVGRNILS